MDILNGNLKPIETSGFRYLYFSTKPINQVLIDSSIAWGKEGKNMIDEVWFILF